MNVAKKLSEWLSADNLQEIDFEDVLMAMSDVVVRQEWVEGVAKEIQRINLDLDRRILEGQKDFSELSGRRKGLQFALESALSIHRVLRGRKVHNRGEFNLDSVTVQPAPR